VTDHVFSFPWVPKPAPMPQVGDKVTAIYDDGVSTMYVVAADPLPDGGVRLRFGTEAPA